MHSVILLYERWRWRCISLNIWGIFPWNYKSPKLGSTKRRPYSCNYFPSRPACTITVHQRHRRTDGQTDGQVTVMAIARFALQDRSINHSMKASMSERRRPACIVVVTLKTSANSNKAYYRRPADSSL